MISAIVFDFDGVLADSEPLHLRAYQEVLSPLGVTLTREDYYARYLGYNDEDMFRKLAEAQGLDDGRAQAGGAHRGERPGATTAIIDSTERALSRRGRLHRSGWRPRFRWASRRAPSGTRSKRCCGAKGSSGTSGSSSRRATRSRASPRPIPYRRAAELHGLPPAACLAIEDSRWGIESAKSAGMSCIAVTHYLPAGGADDGGPGRDLARRDHAGPSVAGQDRRTKNDENQDRTKNRERTTIT